MDEEGGGVCLLEGRGEEERNGSAAHPRGGSDERERR